MTFTDHKGAGLPLPGSGFPDPNRHQEMQFQPLRYSFLFFNLMHFYHIAIGIKEENLMPASNRPITPV